MSYIINYSGGTIDIPIGVADTSNTSITLIGRNWTSPNLEQGFGQALNQNFVSILENFAAPSQPTSPLSGQFWFDTTTLNVKLNTGNSASPTWVDMYSSTSVINQVGNGTSTITFPLVNGPINFSSGANANVMVITDTGVTVTGTLSTTSNTISPVFISTVSANSNISPLTVTSSARVDNLNADLLDGYHANITRNAIGQIVVRNLTTGVIDNDIVGNVTGNVVATTISGSLTTSTSVQTANLTTGANTTSGTITGAWSLTSGSRLNATYADLAEYYTIDKAAGPATVVEFGGDKEVTVCMVDASRRVAGVVSTEPAFIMNEKGGKIDELREAIALQGRVPCKVVGVVTKGDMMVSAGNGCARSEAEPLLGSVIGKALENKDTLDVGIIEIAVGRL